MKRIIFCVLCIGFLSVAHAADSQQGGVHTIKLPVTPPQLPDGPGQKVVIDRCTQCHSADYITMQPRFSKETWTAEVTKMRKVFGGPIADDQVEDIVNYLVSIRGK